MRTDRFFTGILILMIGSIAAAAQIEPAKVRTLVNQYNAQALKEYGPAILPVLVKLYEQSPNEDERGNVATMFYQLGWKSEEAKRVLMKDVHTQNQLLRMRVQYALGRVSSDVLMSWMFCFRICRMIQIPYFGTKRHAHSRTIQIHLNGTPEGSFI